MDVPVQMDPALGSGVRPVGESEYGCGIVEFETYGEAAEVGTLVAENGQLPVDEKSGTRRFAQEVARPQVVVEQHWLDGVFVGLDFLVEELSCSAQGGSSSRICMQAVVKVVAPAAMLPGAGEAAEVGTGDAVDGGQWFGQVLQVVIGRYRIRAKCGLCDPRRGVVRGRGEELRSWGAVRGQQAESGSLVCGAARVAVVLEDVGRRPVHRPDVVGLAGGDLAGA